jgi:hypothetical protein
MATVTTTPTQRELEQLRYEKELRQRSIAEHYQQRADAVFLEWGTRARERVEGEDIETYRRRLAIQAKRMLPVSNDKPLPDSTATFNDLRNLQLKRMPPDIFAGFEPMIYDACAKAVARNDTVPPGEMREITRVDPKTGHKETRFYGQRSFIEDLKGRAFRARIRTPDTHPAWFTGSARQAPVPIGYDQSPWQNAYRKFQISQGHLE